MRHLRTALLVLAITVLSTGCAMVAPQYTASLDNVQTLKDAGNYTVKVGAFAAGKDKAYNNPISIRGSSLTSPYKIFYTNYVAVALIKEFCLGNNLYSDSNV